MKDVGALVNGHHTFGKFYHNRRSVISDGDGRKSSGENNYYYFKYL
ncbi:MAG: hypothetical protein M3525_10995 [Acidobacteriota bacterium]|nr:hypothetical protein [Acidobacteriota bacterium]